MSLKRSTTLQAGFSLVEIMVGMAIGLLTTLVIMQIFSAFEGQKRATTGSADAQTSGSIALFSITRDMQMAGYGLIPAATSPLDCDPSPTTAGGIDLSPIVIVDGGDAAGASDTISIRYGTAATGGVPTEIGAISAGGGTTATMSTNLGCSAGDEALIMNGTSCRIKTVTALDSTTGVVLNNLTDVIVGARLSCLGRWTQLTYQSVGGNLEVNGNPRITGIVNLQAQYGISDSAELNQITQWVDATTATGWDAPSVTVANRNRIKAVRVAVVARNEQFEKEELASSSALCSADGQAAWTSTDEEDSPAPTIDLTNIANCQHYRYRVFETIVPFRNVIWSRDKL